MKLLQPGDFSTLDNFEAGDFLHAVEAYVGQGAVFARAAGSFCQVRSLALEVDSSVSSLQTKPTS